MASASTLLLVAYFFCVCFSTFFAIAILRRASTRYRVLQDHPCGRKQHETPTPVVGGAAMALVLFCAIALIFPLTAVQQIWSFALPALGLGLLGIFDDGLDLSPLNKLIVQIAFLCISLYFLYQGGTFDSLPVEVKGPFLTPILLLFTLGFAGFFVNAFNMIDGVDGLAGSVAFVSLSFCYVCAILAGLSELSHLVLSLGGAVAGFLGWNLRTPLRARAAVFMGDAGSLFVGFSLLWICALLALSSGVPPLLPLWLLAFPLLDGALVAFRRMLNGRNPLKGDRTHFHHLMLNLGLSVPQIVTVACIITGLNAAMGLLLWQAKSSFFTQLLALAGSGFLYFGTMTYLWKKQGE